MTTTIALFLAFVLGVSFVHCDQHGNSVERWDREKSIGTGWGLRTIANLMGGLGQEELTTTSRRAVKRRGSRRTKKVWCKCRRKMVWSWRNCRCGGQRRFKKRSKKRVWCKCKKRMVSHRKYCNCAKPSPSQTPTPSSSPTPTPGIDETVDATPSESPEPEAIIVQDFRGFWCSCLNRQVSHWSACCNCQRRRCKCWNPWWKKWKYRKHFCRRRCSRRC